MNQFKVLALVCTLSASALAAPNPQDAPQAKTAQKKPPKSSSTANVTRRLDEMQQALQSQQEQIQQLKQEVQSRDAVIQQLQQQSSQAQSVAGQADQKAESALSQSKQQQQAIATTDEQVTDLKANATNTALALQETQKSVSESPAAIRYKGITITPGGFVAAESVFRTRAASADINTPFTGIPYTANALSRVDESNFTARQSRLSLLGEGKIGTTKLTGYWEADWLGTGITSNNRQSDSYVMRQRVIYGQVALKSGLSVTAGQMWSLVTEGKKGINNRQELPPLTIDPQYNVGFSWARQYGLRVVQDFGGKFALGVSVEGPQATVGGRGFSSVTTNTAGVTTATGGNTFIEAPGSGGGLFNFADTAGYTLNKSPDIIVKAAFDPGWGHYEVFGIYSSFRNRIYPCGVVGRDSTSGVALACPVDGSTSPSALGAFNDTRSGGGGGVAIRVPVLPNKKLEFAFQGLAGDGIGRYGSAQIADLTFRPNGTEALIRTAHGLGGLELHTNKWDVYAYAGAEYGARAAYTGYDLVTVNKTPAIPPNPANPAGDSATTTTAINVAGIGGYGSLFANNSGCQKEVPPSNTLGQFPPPSVPFTPSSGSSCAGDTRLIGEGTFGFWYKLFNGPRGGLRLGIQYSYFEKYGWSGNNGNGVGVAPKAVDNMVWTSLRYYLP